jgi:hypothetical protein
LLKGRAINPSPKDIGPSGCGKDFESRSLAGKEEVVTQRLLGRIRALEVKTVIAYKVPGIHIVFVNPSGARSREYCLKDGRLVPTIAERPSK